MLTLSRLRPAALGYMVLGLAGMGALNLACRDLLLNWQPAPAGAPWREPAALLSGILFILSAALLLRPRTRRLGAVVGAA